MQISTAVNVLDNSQVIGIHQNIHASRMKINITEIFVHMVKILAYKNVYKKKIDNLERGINI